MYFFNQDLWLLESLKRNKFIRTKNNGMQRGIQCVCVGGGVYGLTRPLCDCLCSAMWSLRNKLQLACGSVKSV